MPTDLVRQRVLDAVKRRELPSGGPSELAARDLLESVPSPYWERWSEDAMTRIRAWSSGR